MLDVEWSPKDMSHFNTRRDNKNLMYVEILNVKATKNDTEFSEVNAIKDDMERYGVVVE